MNDTILTLYFISASIGIIAMIPQIKRLIATKQSDSLSLTTWGTWFCCQIVSFIYALSIGATGYIYVSMVWIGFYATMVFLIIRYRKRHSLLATILYWFKRGREEKRQALVFKKASALLTESRQAD